MLCYRTQAARDLWWNTLHDVLGKEKEKDPKSTNIQVTYYDLSTSIEYVSLELTPEFIIFDSNQTNLRIFK